MKKETGVESAYDMNNKNQDVNVNIQVHIYHGLT